MPNISVIVPCYNGEAVLARCVDSLLKQTLPLQEIIIINDGSTDGSEALAQSYADRHPNVRLITKENQGLPQARKTGIEAAHGEYIGCIDCDDWVEPDAYRRLYEAITASGADIANCGFRRCYSDGTKKTEGQCFADGSVHSAKEAYHALHTRRDVYAYMWNKLYRAELFKNIVFPEGNFTGEDYVTLIQLLKVAGNVVTVNGALFNYWQGDVSMSRGGFKKSHYLSHFHYKKATEEMMAAFPEMSGDIHCYMAVEYMSYILAMDRSKNYDMAMLKEIQQYIRRNLPQLLATGDFSLLYKGCAVAVSIHYKLFTTAYSLLQG